jgi:hypothetical protein
MKIGERFSKEYFKGSTTPTKYSIENYKEVCHLASHVTLLDDVGPHNK